MAVHAFIDESGREQHYYLCVALVKPSRVTKLRRQLADLLLPPQRDLRFARERQARRRTIADSIAELPVGVEVYRTTRTPGTDELARQSCLEVAIGALAGAGASRVVINSRNERDKQDATTIRGLLGGHPADSNFAYEHVSAEFEPLCWIADTVAWCFGAGADWRERVMPIVTDVVELEKARR